MRSAPTAATRQTAAAAGQSANGADGEQEAADRGADGSGEAPRERVHGEVAPAQVAGGDLGDERLVRRAVEALPDPEEAERDRDRRRTRPCP